MGYSELINEINLRLADYYQVNVTLEQQKNY
jgi:hypothetical protein